MQHLAHGVEDVLALVVFNFMIGTGTAGSFVDGDFVEFISRTNEGHGLCVVAADTFNDEHAVCHGSIASVVAPSGEDS